MESWPVKALGDVCHVIGGGTPQKDKEHYFKGTIPWATVRDMRKDVISETEFQITEEAVEASSTNIIPAHNVVIATRVGLGKVCFVERDTAINQDLRGIVPIRKSELSVHYLFWWLRSIAHLIAQEGTGATVQGVKLPFIKSLEIPLSPLPEQKRIVAILDEAFAGIAAATANAEKNLANARELFDGCLDEAFSETKTGRKLATLTELTTDITDGDHMPPPKSLTGVPFITISNIHKGTNAIDFSDTFKVPRAYFDNLKPNKRPQLGDVLYTVTGSFGIPVIVQDSTEFCFQRHIGLVRPKKGVNSKWLYYALLSPPAFKQAADGATGTAQKTVSLKVLRSLQLPDIPLVEQVAMASRLDALYARTKSLESVYTEKLASILELKRALLQKAFSGELAALPGAEMQEAAA